MKYKINRIEGYSLIEVVLASAIGLVAFMSISSLAVSSFGTKSDLENRRAAGLNSQEIATTLSNLELCKANMTKPPGIQFNAQPGSPLATTGIPITLYNIDASNNLTSEVIVGPGQKLGGLTVSSVLLVATDPIDPAQSAAKIMIYYQTNSNGRPVYSEIPIIVKFDPNNYYLISECSGGDLLANLLKKNKGQLICSTMQNMFWGGSWIYDPVSGQCVPTPKDYKKYVGTATDAFCTPDHPYFSSCMVDTTNLVDVCPPGVICGYKYPGGATSNVVNYRCSYQTGPQGQDGALCEYALGTSGGSCQVTCTDRP